jgi:hypothetical protein
MTPSLARLVMEEEDRINTRHKDLSSRWTGGAIMALEGSDYSQKILWLISMGL